MDIRPLNPLIFLFLIFPTAASIWNEGDSTVNDQVSITLTIPQNQVAEWSYSSGKVYKNPFAEVLLEAEIEGPEGIRMILPAFWAGENEWRFRFSAPREGIYHFTTRCSDKKNKVLHRQKGTIRMTEFTGENMLYQRGPVRINAGHHYLEHADGTPFFWLADSWWHGMTTRFKWPEDFKLLTADRKEKGFSVIQFAIGFPCDIAPFDPVEKIPCEWPCKGPRLPFIVFRHHR